MPKRMRHCARGGRRCQVRLRRAQWRPLARGAGRAFCCWQDRVSATVLSPHSVHCCRHVLGRRAARRARSAALRVRRRGGDGRVRWRGRHMVLRARRARRGERQWSRERDRGAVHRALREPFGGARGEGAGARGRGGLVGHFSQARADVQSGACWGMGLARRQRWLWSSDDKADAGISERPPPQGTAGHAREEHERREPSATNAGPLPPAPNVATSLPI
jgi:hypothetical protein